MNGCYLTSVVDWINPLRRNRITAQNIIFFNLRKIDNSNKWMNYVIFTRVRLSVELDVLVIREQPIYIEL